MNTPIEVLKGKLQKECYVASPTLATVIYLCQELKRPLLLEGPAGVGKTELAKVLSKIYKVDLIRLQCYEGLDAGHAIYEWDYARQLLATRSIYEKNEAKGSVPQNVYSNEYLIERPLLKTLRTQPAPVLLIDEVDRADEEFEALLLEFLSDFQISIPEIGTFQADSPPIVILTSNRTRDLSDALRRRCLYFWIDYPSLEKEEEIIRLRVPQLSEKLTSQVAEAVRRIRKLSLFKPPGVAESIDWAEALSILGADDLNRAVMQLTLSCVVKTEEDLEFVTRKGIELL